MKHHIILTAYNRPEMLSVCLDRLHECIGIDQAHVVVREDCRPKSNQSDMDAVTSKAAKYGFTHVKRNCVGPFWENIFTCLHEAIDSNVDLIHVLEDDVFVQKDFLRWVEKVQKFEPWVACAANEWTHPSDNPNLIGVSNSDFSSRAFSINRQNLISILRNDRNYERHVEEIIHRTIIRDRRLMVFPLLPRATPLQWGGVNINNEPHITIEKIYANLPRPIQESGELVIGADRRNRWERDYVAQARFGF